MHSHTRIFEKCIYTVCSKGGGSNTVLWHTVKAVGVSQAWSSHTALIAMTWMTNTLHNIGWEENNIATVPFLSNSECRVENQQLDVKEKKNPVIVNVFMAGRDDSEGCPMQSFVVKHSGVTLQSLCCSWSKCSPHLKILVRMWSVVWSSISSWGNYATGVLSWKVEYGNRPLEALSYVKQQAVYSLWFTHSFLKSPIST